MLVIVTLMGYIKHVPIPIGKERRSWAARPCFSELPQWHRPSVDILEHLLDNPGMV